VIKNLTDLHELFFFRQRFCIGSFASQNLDLFDEFFDDIRAETRRIGTPSLKIIPTFLPKVIPSCESCASPGPLTAQPIIER
jgi:hypothetical protein